MWRVAAAIRQKTPSCSRRSLLVAPKLRNEIPLPRHSRSRREAIAVASLALDAADSARVTMRTVCTS